jgi:hypothetical protein
MRIQKGRVMHQVRPWATGNGYQSVCCQTKKGRRKISRVVGHRINWTADNPLDYPNCPHCPDDEEGTQ